MAFLSLEQLAERIESGKSLCVAKDESGVAMAVTRVLARRAVAGDLRDIHLITVPIAGIQADILIGAGAIGLLETSAITLGEYGAAPCFVRAVKNGAIRLRDGTCPAIYAGIQAGEKGIPFMPLRGIVESDLMKHRDDWRVIDNPFANAEHAPDPIVAIAAIRPDVSLFHAPYADRFGNVFIGRQREVATMAHASAETYVTVERIVEGDLTQDVERAGSTIPAIYVSGIAVVPQGAAPLECPRHYARDEATLRAYARAAATPEGFAAWLDAWLAEEREAVPA